MYISCNALNTFCENSYKEIAYFNGICYEEKSNCAVISLKGFLDIYLPMNKSVYEKLARLIELALARGSQLFEIEVGICLCVGNPAELPYLKERAKQLYPLCDPFSYRF